MNLRSGLSRRPIQAALVDKLADLVERVSATFADVPFEAKFERLVLAYIALAVLYSTDLRREVHRLAGVVFLRGLPILATAPDAMKETVITYLSDLAREELLISIALKLGSIVSPDAFNLIFPRPATLPPLHPPTARDLDLIISTDEATLEEYERLKRPTFDRPVIILLDEVTRLLSFFPSDALVTTVKKCWRYLDVGSQYINHLVRSLSDALERLSPRSRADPPGREYDFLSHLSLYHVGHIHHLWSCHFLLENARGLGEQRAELLATAVARLDRVRVNVANHIRLMMTIRSGNPRKDMMAANKLVQAIEVSRGPNLTSWCLRYPQEAKHFLRAARVAAFGYPEAARLALELKEILKASESSLRFSEVTSPAEVEAPIDDALEVVNGALRDLAVS